MAVIKIKDLSKIRRIHPNEKIVFCSGVFDLTHAGHALFFEDCKKQGDILVVAVGRDADIRKYKGNGHPILNQYIRLKMIDSMKAVDYCLLGSSIKKTDMIMPMRGMLMRLLPDIYAVNNDAFDMPARRRLVRECGAKLTVCKRSCPVEFGEISTTKIIETIRRFDHEKKAREDASGFLCNP